MVGVVVRASASGFGLSGGSQFEWQQE